MCVQAVVTDTANRKYKGGWGGLLKYIAKQTMVQIQIQFSKNEHIHVIQYSICLMGFITALTVFCPHLKYSLLEIIIRTNVSVSHH